MGSIRAMLHCIPIFLAVVTPMIETLLQTILEQVEQPKKDLEHNLRALLQEAVSKMDLVSQDEFERQRQALEQANLRLDKLMQHIEALEQQLKEK